MKLIKDMVIIKAVFMLI